MRLNINQTDISSDAIERVINPDTLVFSNIKTFEVNDHSQFRGAFGVFLGLLKNMREVEHLYLNTQDFNINTLLDEFLPHMPKLETLSITKGVRDDFVERTGGVIREHSKSVNIIFCDK